jgi:predicted dehydrogenase
MRAAIVGAGGIARVHARIIHELGGTLVGVCGRTRGAAEAFGAGEPYDDLARMLKETRPDVVHICTPNRLHAGQAIAAFAAGAHVLCEKPMAVSTDECARMMEAAGKAGRIGAIAYCYRGYPLVEVLRARVGEGAFGPLRRIGGRYLSQDVVDPAKYVWHFTPGSVGPAFTLMDYGVHWFDLAEYVSGQRITEVFAAFSTHQRQRVWHGLPGEGVRPLGTQTPDGGVAIDVDLEDQADLLVRFDGGAGGSISISAVSPGNPNNLALEVDGARAGFDWQQESPNVYVERIPAGSIVHQRTPDLLPAGRSWMSAMPGGTPEGYVDAFRNVVRQGWMAMKGDDVVYPTFADGLRGIALVEAAVASAAGRKPVAVPG